MEFRETTKEDLVFVADHSVSRGIQKNHPEQTEFCYTLAHEGVPLGVGGFTLINFHTAWCWVDLTDGAGSHIKTVYRVMKEWIDEFIIEHKLTRLQAYVECDFPAAVRMVKHLGFKEEWRMENFMGDKDAYMFVRII